MQKGILYLVPTPIGNLGDMTYRGVEILKSVDIIAAEDTRTSTKLLKHYEIKNKLISYHKFNERKQSDILISLLSEGKNVAIITDSGTPGISDPANIIVKEAIEHNIQVCCLPGASAVITALAASGLNTDTFTFAGFLPAKKKDRDNLLKALEKLPHTIVLYEASHRIIDTLKELAEVFGSRECVIARELSKLYETYLRGKLSDLAYASDMETRGEFVILIEGRKEQPLTDAELIRIISDEAKQGIALKELSSKVSDITGINRNRIYKLALALKKCNESV
jgi:16S rRNA (cytidine1402-2'-O)-methyltransferase